MKVGALLHPEHPGDLDLGKNDVVWQGSSQTVVEHLLWLRHGALDIERPNAGSATKERPEPRDDNERQREKEYEQEYGGGLHERRDVACRFLCGLTLS